MSAEVLALPLITALASEQALVGAALFDAEACAGPFDRLRPEHFSQPVHAELWAMCRMGVPIDIGLAAQKLEHLGPFNDLGGIRYLADLIDKAVTHTVEQHADVVLDAALRRNLQCLAKDIADRAGRETGAGEALISELERGASDIAQDASTKDMWKSGWDVVQGALRSARERGGRIEYPTGLRDLDRLTGGFRRGEMAIVAGRPGMAKSTAALSISKTFAQAGKGVAFFSMEMPDVALGLRLACDLAHDPYAPAHFRISYFDADQGRLDGSQWKELESCAATVSTWPLHFDTRPGLTTSQMEACARRAFRRWEANGVQRGCVIVDHLTIARTDQDRRGNKVAEIGDISRGLAEMAKRLDVPVIALCQLSRDVEKREGKDRRPGLSDLRWSGEIEQDARLVTFLYRPEYYLKKPQDETDDEAMMVWKEKLSKVRHKLFWLVEKNSNGPTGEVGAYCDVACSAIRDKLGSGE